MHKVLTGWFCYTYSAWLVCSHVHNVVHVFLCGIITGKKLQKAVSLFNHNKEENAITTSFLCNFEGACNSYLSCVSIGVIFVL